MDKDKIMNLISEIKSKCDELEASCSDEYSEDEETEEESTETQESKPKNSPSKGKMLFALLNKK